MNIKQTLDRYYNILRKYEIELSEFSINAEIILEAIKSCTEVGNIWVLNLHPFKINIPHKFIPSHTIPIELRECGQDIEITLLIKDQITIKKLTKNNIEDPFCDLKEFNILINSDLYVASWHLDRHIFDGNKCAYMHPLYHFTFGGHYMENKKEVNKYDYGNAIIMRNPRLMHPPMEIILGIDFILTHFIPNECLTLLDDKIYKEIIHQMKSYIWKPYFLGILKNFCAEISVDNEKQTFNDQFVFETHGSN